MQLNKDIKRLIINVCGRISYLTVIFFFLTLLLYTHNDIKESLKEAWIVSNYFLAALATLGTAILAANLFSDWKAQEKYRLTSKLALECLENYLLAKDKLLFYLFQHVYKNQAISFKELDDFFIDTANKLRTLNEVLLRTKQPTIDKEIIDSFYENNYLVIIKGFENVEELKYYDEKKLDNCHKAFIYNKTMNRLPEKLLDVLKLD